MSEFSPIFPMPVRLFRSLLSASVRPLIVLAMGLCVSLYAAYFVHSYVAKAAQAKFETRASKVAEETHRRMQVFVDALRGLRGLFAASDSIQRRDFRAYAQSREMLADIPGALGYTYIQRVPRTELSRFIEETRADDAPEFQVRTSGNRADLFIIKFVEPLDTNFSALGFDVGSDPVRRAPLEKSILTGEASLIGPVALVQDPQRRKGYVIALPHYRNGAHPTTSAEREAALEGWMTIPVLIEEVLANAIEAADNRVEFEVFRGAEALPENLIFDSDHTLCAVASDQPFQTYCHWGRYRRAMPIQVCGQTWTLYFSSSPPRGWEPDSLAPVAVALGGCIATLLATALVHSLSRGQRQALELAAKLTEEHRQSEARATEACAMAEKSLAELRQYTQEVENARAYIEEQACTLQFQAELLHDAREKAEAANAAKSAFLANMSHEIRSPLTSILGYADLLAESRSDGSLSNAEIVATIRRAGEHLLAIINDILDLSKIEAGKLQLELVETSLPSVLREVESLLRHCAGAKGLDFRFRLATPVPATFRCDPTRLRQILMNLAGNAVKFTEVGHVTVSAAYSAGPRPKLRIDVEDSGPGMNDAQIAQLFAPFMQADATVTRRFGGTGLGLTICRRLAHMLGGEVVLVRSAPGEGSCFRVEIPCECGAGVEFVAELPPFPTVSANQPLPALRGRILLAEDGPENQRLIAFLLRKAGATVEIAENGRVALDLLAADKSQLNAFDLLVTDMQMPVMDGFTLVRTLRAAGDTIPIVALTANAMVEDEYRCRAAGCNDFTTKPIDKARLLGVCAKLLPQEAMLACS
jgi:signal transduction histidine kinase/ActR/RegA family two-component response regulator